MSGTFNPDEPGITATDDADLARKLGFSQYNRATEQWEAPTAPDAGMRDGTDVPGHVDFVAPEPTEDAPADDAEATPARKTRGK